MHPLKERKCDDLLENPGLKTPPPEPEKPRPPRIRRPRVFKLPVRFPLVSKAFYETWCTHQKELQMMTHRIDNSPPPLFPEMYLKPRRLDLYAKELAQNMVNNKDLVKRINYIQRNGGFVDCWQRVRGRRLASMLRKARVRAIEEIRRKNAFIYSRLLIARSQQPKTKELNKLWEETKLKLMLGSALPFILFDTEKLDRNIHDPAFDRPPGIRRYRVMMEIWVRNGAKIGRVLIELFNDIVPHTCKLFMTFVKGDKFGHAYCGTKFFRIVPNLYCCGGDVTKNNGFGCYLPEGEPTPRRAENFHLRHTVPGVLSMAVSNDNEVCGQFNIVFKPLPQFDGKHVVFGRIIAGPTQTLERISALGLPLGTTSTECIIRYTGYYNRKGELREGKVNTIKFPPSQRNKWADD